MIAQVHSDALKLFISSFIQKHYGFEFQLKIELFWYEVNVDNYDENVKLRPDFKPALVLN